jgi:hypothetical protein
MSILMSGTGDWEGWQWERNQDDERTSENTEDGGQAVKTVRPWGTRGQISVLPDLENLEVSSWQLGLGQGDWSLRPCMASQGHQGHGEEGPGPALQGHVIDD